MERRDLEKIYSYLPVIVATCDRYGWCGGRGAPISNGAIPEVRIFMEYLQEFIPLKKIPELEDLIGDSIGAITLLWETEIDPVDVTYDSFYISLSGNGEITYKGDLESIGIKTYGDTPLEPELHPDIIEYIKFFQRKQDELKKIQELETSKSNTNKCMQ